MSIRSLFPILLMGSLLFQAAYPLTVRASSEADWGEAGALQRVIPGELIVGMKNGYSAQMLDLPTGAAVKHTSPQLSLLRAAVIRVPPGQENEFAKKMRGRRGVRYAEPNYRVEATIVPDDSLWPQQYGPAHIQAPAAWDITTGSASVTVAVIDSGIDSNHPEFAGRIVPGYDFVEDDTVPQDECGHGTHVSGIIAAAGNNSAGIAGLAWNVRIMPVRVLKSSCLGSASDIAEALVWAVERGARVINVSIGTSAASTLLENGTFYAYTHGAAIFAAAGNFSNSPVLYPAAYAWVTAVGSTDQNDVRVSTSNTGTALDLMAPGEDIYSTTPLQSFFYEALPGTPQQYGLMSGTSMAAAHASGAAALLASLPQFDSPDKIYQALISTALDLDAAGRDNNTGYGLIQLANALSYSPSVIATPTAAPPAATYDLADSLTCGNLVQYGWRDATTGSSVPIFGNDGYATVALPFWFTLGGQAYSALTISANGYLTFGGLGSATENFLIPAIAQPNNFLAPFWDDLDPSAGGQIYQATFGSTPNREFVVEWHQIPRYVTGGSSLTFEVILFENNGRVLFQYQTLTGAGADGASATIGVEYANGSAGQEYSYNQAGALQPQQAILFTPYPTGSTPPSDSCSTYTRHVNQGGVFESGPFCLIISDGALQHPAILQIQPLNSAPALPESFRDLHHYADISLRYSPAPPLSPVPEAYVCYHYSLDDVLKAGGHPENLFFAIYNAGALSWEQLPTSVDTGQGIIMALGPHFSIYGVATYPGPRRLPVTGGAAPTGALRDLLVFTGLLALIKFVRVRWRRQPRNAAFS